MQHRFPPHRKINMKILPLALTLLVSCSKADVPAADNVDTSCMVSKADCRETQMKGDLGKTADWNKVLSRTRFVLDMKHTSQVQLFRLSITMAATMPLALFVGAVHVYEGYRAFIWRFKPEYNPLLASADEAKYGDCVITMEGFGSPGKFETVAFDDSGTGYAATKGNNLKPYTFLKSLDNGRTWSRVSTLKGSCSEIVPHKEEVYFISRSREIWKFRTQEDFAPEKVAAFGREKSIYKLKVFDDSTFVCGMNAIYRDLDSMTVLDSLMVSKDAGKTWSGMSLPGKFSAGANSLAYSENNLYAVLSTGQGMTLLVKDMRSGKEQTFPLGSLYNIAASDDLLASHSGVDFWQYDGENMNELSDFGWNPSNGSYHPKYLKKNGELAICIASQYPGEEGKVWCIFGSVDGGRHWQAIWMGDDVGCPTEHVGGAPDDAVSVFFTSGDRHYILTLRKKA